MKNEREEITSLLAIYAERLEQMNQSHTALNQSVSDLSVSLQNIMDNGGNMKEKTKANEVEQARIDVDEKTSEDEASKLAQHR